jgi:hypothetical protein
MMLSRVLFRGPLRLSFSLFIQARSTRTSKKRAAPTYSAAAGKATAKKRKNEEVEDKKPGLKSAIEVNSGCIVFEHCKS